MNKLKFIHVAGPFGDQTSGYEIEFEKPMTVKQFMDAVITERSGEWGNFALKNDWTKKLAEYKHGSITIINDSYYPAADKTIKSISANGGWSLMSYDIVLENE